MTGCWKNSAPQIQNKQCANLTENNIRYILDGEIP